MHVCRWWEGARVSREMVDSLGSTFLQKLEISYMYDVPVLKHKSHDYKI